MIAQPRPRNPDLRAPDKISGDGFDPFAPGLITRVAPPRKVVLVRASRIGDFICATPTFRALRRSLPGAEITLIGLPFVEDLVVRSPHLDRFVAFPGFPGMAEQFFDARATSRFLRSMQAEAFDLAIQMHGSGLNSNPFTLMLGATSTAGFVREGDPPGRLDAALPAPERGPEVRRIAALSDFLGAPDAGKEVEFPIRPEDHAAAEQLLAGAERPLIGVHPATWDAIKRWPLRRFAEAAGVLQRCYGGTVVVLGTSPDRAGPRPGTVERIRRAVGPKCLSLVDRTPLGVLGAVIDRLSVLITNDSGPAHIAYALRAPSVTIFGGTDPEQWGPMTPGPHRVLAFGVPCRPCALPACPIGYRCLRGVTVEAVASAADEVLRA